MVTADHWENAGYVMGTFFLPRKCRLLIGQFLYESVADVLWTGWYKGTTKEKTMTVYNTGNYYKEQFRKMSLSSASMY